MSYIEAAQWNAMKQKAYEYDRMEERAKKAEDEVERLKAQIKRLYERGQSLEAEAEVERLTIEIKGLRDELERYNPPSALRPPAGWVPMLSDNGHYWGCPTQAGGKCDCADLDKAEPVGGLVFQQPQATVGPKEGGR